MKCSAKLKESKQAQKHSRPPDQEVKEFSKDKEVPTNREANLAVAKPEARIKERTKEKQGRKRGRMENL